mmetsp:Transcript_13235/g.34714  ORF Transcript_13235/g.34714 Transcript_13235/m.34714 type:complete len:240 (-) Transcript_13235:288-1007(-)
MAGCGRSFLGALVFLFCLLSLLYGIGFTIFGIVLSVDVSLLDNATAMTCAGSEQNLFNCSLAPHPPHGGDSGKLHIPAFTLGVIVLGGVVVVLSSFGMAGGRSKNRCLLLFFAFFDFLILLAEAAIAIIFIIPATKKWIDALICDTGLTPAEVKVLGTFLFCYEMIAGYVMLGLGGLQLLSFIFAVALRSAARRSSSDEWAAARSKDQTELLLGSGSKGKSGTNTKGKAKASNSSTVVI